MLAQGKNRRRRLSSPGGLSAHLPPLAPAVRRDAREEAKRLTQLAGEGECPPQEASGRGRGSGLG